MAIADIAAVASVAASVTSVGMSAASAAGAFNRPVAKNVATPQELASTQYNTDVMNQGLLFQQQLDPIYMQRYNIGQQNVALYQPNIDAATARIGDAQTRYQQVTDSGQRYLGMENAVISKYASRLHGLFHELGTLHNEKFYQQAADQSVNQAWAATPAAKPGLDAAGMRSGVGSGQWLATLNSQGNQMFKNIASANVEGRLGYLNQYSQRRQQYGTQLDNQVQRVNNYASDVNSQAQRQISAMNDVGSSIGYRNDLYQQQGNALAGQEQMAQGLYNDMGNRVQTGLGLINGGAGQAAQQQNNLIGYQIGQNQAMASGVQQLAGLGMGISSSMGGNTGGAVNGLAQAGYGVGNAAGAAYDAVAALL